MRDAMGEAGEERERAGHTDAPRRYPPSAECGTSTCASRRRAVGVGRTAIVPAVRRTSAQPQRRALQRH